MQQQMEAMMRSPFGMMGPGMGMPVHPAIDDGTTGRGGRPPHMSNGSGSRQMLYRPQNQLSMFDSMMGNMRTMMSSMHQQMVRNNFSH